MRAALGSLVLASTLSCGSFGTVGSSSGSDAGSGTTSGDASSGFCVAHPTALFCADFEGVAKVDDGWSGLDNGGNAKGTVTLATDGKSPPGAALFEVPSAPAGSRLELRKSGLPNAKKIRFGFDFRPTTPSEDVAYISFDSTCAFNMSPGGPVGGVWEETGQGTGTQFDLTTGIAQGTWGRFEIELDWDAKAFVVRIDGKSVLRKSGVMLTGCVFDGSGTFSVNVGPHYFSTAPAAPIELRYDNVLVEALP